MFASSSVEDIFFVLQNVTTRAITSNSSKCFSSVFALVTKILEKDVVSFVQRKISAAFTPTEIKENRQSAFVSFFIMP
jgi:COG4 transport protein